VLHAGLTGSLWAGECEAAPTSWLAIDALGLLFLTSTSALFLASSVYLLGYLRQEETAPHVDRDEGFYFNNEPEAVFIGCLLLFLASMTLVTMSHHFGLLWAGVEATTLASAPLIYFHCHHRSLEATWKYLLLCSVGIALALLGNFLLSLSTTHEAGAEVQLIAGHLLGKAPQLDPTWLKAAFLFFLVGYGTKMGLAPMHTWLPDAHSEAPSPVSALLSGALLNCALLGLLRAHGLCVAAGVGDFSRSLFVVFGLLSMGIAAVFILRQADFKRMLAYSSVEHMGILALGIGIGGAGVFGALFHAFNHSLTKAALFLTGGNMLSAYRSKNIGDVRGVGRVLPVTGVLWLAGFLAICGSPPFGTFLSEFTILKATLDGNHHLVAFLYLALLGLIFVGMTNIVLPMAQGEPGEKSCSRPREGALTALPPAVLLTAVLVAGLFLPSAVEARLRDAERAFVFDQRRSGQLSAVIRQLSANSLSAFSDQP
jgi:hydrogenase-4 component F